ncbi:predicted protein [Chaetoceros tenuissimus]|uniref:Uncharacterized protein n=1 Tax=Chaetoceros tenuissimus TaxID=426638 RepID=A0AAD3D285_9STRA|nr:predicted protein [Chaetoceros tenuissimus]
MISTNITIHDILESLQGDFLKYLTVKEICILRHISKSHSFLKWSKIELERRYHSWLTTCSRAWSPPSHSLVSADDLPLDEEMKRQLRDIAINMSGGLELFLHNRETGAPKQPNLFEFGKDVHYITLGNEYSSVPFVAMFDIYCNGKHVWNGVKPILASDLGNICYPGDDDDDENYIDATIIEPFSSNSLGDETDEATYHAFSHGFRVNKYLLSTDVNDTRTYTLNVSFLTPKSRETLVLSVDIEPQQVLKDIENKTTWDDQHEMFAEHIAGCGGVESEESQWYSLDKVLLDEKLKRCSGFYWEPKKGTKIMAVTKRNKLIECNLDRNRFDICFWLDERDPSNKKFHVTADFSFENDLLGGMILDGR